VQLRQYSLLLTWKSEVGWTSQKQKAVALSTAEAEYIAESEAVREAVWLRNVLSDLGFPQKEVTSIYQDNTTAMAWSHDEAYSKRGKRIDVRYHYTMDRVKIGNERVQFTGTRDMVADIMTKPLNGEELRAREIGCNCVNRCRRRSEECVEHSSVSPPIGHSMI
jgi:hypothetical protein